MKHLNKLFIFIIFLNVITAKAMLLPSSGLSILFSEFTGSGFSPGATSSGQLDSNSWSVSGLSDGNLNFGGSANSDDFARGISSGGVTTGGIYAFDTGEEVIGLGIQATKSDFTPGSLILKVTNNSGTTYSGITLSYDIAVRNDQGRSNSFNSAHSADNSSYTHLSTLDYTSTAAADDSPTWLIITRSTTIENLNITDDSSYYIRWTGDDVGGSKFRDEFALTSINLTPTFDGSPIPEAEHTAVILGGLAILCIITRHK